MINLKLLLYIHNLINIDELEVSLSGNNFVFYKSAQTSEALRILKETEIDIVIIEVKSTDKNGITLLKEIKNIYPDIEVILISEDLDIEMVIKAMRANANDFVLHPLQSNNLKNAILHTRRYKTLSNQLTEIKTNNEILNKALKAKFKWDLIVESKGMKEVLNLVTKVAKTDKTTVLITGESGTGKEIIASAIHYLSQRKDYFFSAVNCSAIPDNLFESEFFGHKKGSFTDAIETKSGLFESTNKGSLFLDEIGDLKYELQGKFLRVLEEGKITKIGSSKVIDVDVRVIAATNRDLRKLCDEGKFRIDLLHRLNSFVINLPPLRERRDAIPALLDYYVKQFAIQSNKRIKGIDDNTIQILTDYSFPGNIRELRNMVERAVILCDDEIIKLKHFQFNYSDAGYKQLGDNLYKNLNLAETERELIKLALIQTNNNKSQAARLLGIDRKKLLRKINLYLLK
ncbi:MAG: sigma-54-dependent transcriptional regulator [Bacteroidales bacterium]